MGVATLQISQDDIDTAEETGGVHLGAFVSTAVKYYRGIQGVSGSTYECRLEKQMGRTLLEYPGIRECGSRQFLTKLQPLLGVSYSPASFLEQEADTPAPHTVQSSLRPMTFHTRSIANSPHQQYPTVSVSTAQSLRSHMHLEAKLAIR